MAYALARNGGEKVVDEKLVKDFFVDSVDSPDTLNYARGVVGNVVVVNRSRVLFYANSKNSCGMDFTFASFKFSKFKTAPNSLKTDAKFKKLFPQ